jgi:lysophospholipase L1-like esterase
MSRGARIAAVGLFLALLASAALNGVLYVQGRDYYLQLNATRLDPLGSSAFPVSDEPPPSPVVVVVGDSRAAEWPPPERLDDATVINRGIGSQTSTQVAGRFEQHVAPLTPTVVLIQVGINDLKTIPLFPELKETIVENCKANIDALVGMSLETGARVVVTTVIPLGKLPIQRRPFWSDDVAQAIAEVNAHIGGLAGGRVTVFDTGPVLTNSRGIVKSEYSRDFLHLNQHGYAALNRALAGVLMP